MGLITPRSTLVTLFAMAHLSLVPEELCDKKLTDSANRHDITAADDGARGGHGCSSFLPSVHDTNQMVIVHCDTSSSPYF